ncbi:MAG: OmpH family outer membrane protein [Cytophagales bacterium]|nr:OmpH family outer membrane protein [Cytophagales bacterium]
MNNSKSIWIIMVLIAVALGVNYYFTFQSGKLAMVDSNKLLQHYQGMINARNEFAVKAKGWQANIDTLAKELNTSMEEYQSDKPSLSSKEKELTEQLIQSKSKQLVDYQNAISQQSQQEDGIMTQRVLNEVNTFLTDYGKSQGYDVIFGATGGGNIIYTRDYIDITDEVIEKLNASY